MEQGWSMDSYHRYSTTEQPQFALSTTHPPYQKQPSSLAYQQQPQPHQQSNYPLDSEFIQQQVYQLPLDEDQVTHPIGVKPCYVNPKQYVRIIKRRAARAKRAAEEEEKEALQKTITQPLNPSSSPNPARSATKRSAAGNDATTTDPSTPSYMYQSRHLHAVKRPRGKGGRFLSVEEIQAMNSASSSAGGTAGGPSDPVGLSYASLVFSQPSSLQPSS